jgi:HTH-type transcriptional regulator / antitoxin HigA
MIQMGILKYTIIKDKEQYDKYCDILEDLILHSKNQDEIDLLTLLIEKWDNEHNTIKDSDPIELLKALMNEHNLKAKDLVDILNLSKGTISKILNYQKGLSKDTIRNLSDFFKVSQEAFNRPYRLKNEVNRHFRNASLMNTKKKIAETR